MRAGAVRADVDVARVAGLLHLVHQLQQCARRRVFLRRSGGSPRPRRRTPARRPAAARPRPPAGRTRSRRSRIRAPDQAGAVLLDGALARDPSCSSQPVVPTTTWTPSAAMPSTLPATAAGMENSIADVDARESSAAVRPAPFALLNSSSFSATSKPYSGASCSISLPILP